MTISHSPNRTLNLLVQSWVDELTTGHEEGLLSTLLDGQLAVLIPYFKTKTSLLLYCAYLLKREFYYIEF